MEFTVVWLGLKVFNSDNFNRFSWSRKGQFCRKITIENKVFISASLSIASSSKEMRASHSRREPANENTQKHDI